MSPTPTKSSTSAGPTTSVDDERSETVRLPARTRRRRRLYPLAIITLVVVALAILTWAVATSGPESTAPATPEASQPAATSLPSTAPVSGLEVDGLEDGALLTTEALSTFELSATTTGDAISATLDGQEVGSLDDDGQLVIGPDDLADLGDGDHTIVVTIGADGLQSDATARLIDFTIDTTPPTLTLPDTIEATGIGDPLEVEFTAQGAIEVAVAEDTDATVTLSRGVGTVSYESPPTSVRLVAVDEAGNETIAEVPVIVAFPGGRAVHTTPAAWQYEPKRTPIIEMIEQGRINAVELDIKDEAGLIGFDSDVELANATGADEVNAGFDVAAAIAEIHDLGARVIGRLVVYNDPVLAQWAWENGHRDWVIQTPGGEPFTGSYGAFAFTNFANSDVQQYNVDIAVEAAELGFDDILYDYIRRPDGNLDNMVFPGLDDRDPAEAVVEMMATAYPLLRERGVWVGASVFGISVTRPEEIAQDIELMADHVDYIAPMVYPNHWGSDEYGLDSPVDQPYEIVYRSLSDFQEAVEGTDTVIMPWLQDFGGYGEAEVRAQIQATADATGHEWFLLWNPSANFTASALDPISEG